MLFNRVLLKYQQCLRECFLIHHKGHTPALAGGAREEHKGLDPGRENSCESVKSVAETFGKGESIGSKLSFKTLSTMIYPQGDYVQHYRTTPTKTQRRTSPASTSLSAAPGPLLGGDNYDPISSLWMASNSKRNSSIC